MHFSPKASTGKDALQAVLAVRSVGFLTDCLAESQSRVSGGRHVRKHSFLCEVLFGTSNGNILPTEGIARAILICDTLIFPMQHPYNPANPDSAIQKQLKKTLGGPSQELSTVYILRQSHSF